MVASQRGWQRCRAAFAVYKTIRRSRSTAAATILSRLQQQLQQDQLDAAVVASLLASSAAEDTNRRKETRALGKWRGSTLSGYLRNDEKSCRDNFRTSDNRLSTLVSLLEKTPLDRADSANVQLLDRGRRVTRKATEARDPPTLRYKVATCMYAMAHGGPIKVLADVASIGTSTLRKWLNQFADGMMTRVKPIYMPGKPWDVETLAPTRFRVSIDEGLC